MMEGSRLMAWGFFENNFKFVIIFLGYLQICYYLCSVNNKRKEVYMNDQR